jgi:outer membrane biosynthesis protein TonB
MRSHLSTLHAPVGSLTRRVLVLLAAVSIVVVLLPASATGQEAPGATTGDAATQDAEPAPDAEPAETTPTETTRTETTPAETTPTETTPTETTPTETTPTETTPTETTPTETSPTPTEEPSPSGCASQGTESVVTDESEYAPGSTTHITGTGFAASCEASIDIAPAEGGSAPVVIEVETSSDGQLVGDYLVDGAPGAYEVRVLGADDAVLASTTFTMTAEESSPAECAAQGTESVATDKSEYAPGSTVHITGDGYAASCDLRVEVTRPDGSAVTAPAQVAPAVEEPDAASSAPAVEADDSSATGAFQYEFALGELTGRYKVRVLSAAGEALASTTFAVKEPAPTSCERLGTESIATGKADYSPGETVHMTGAGYAPSCLVKVEVTRPDGSVVKGDGSFEPGVDEVRTTARGRLAYAYVLNGIEGLYRVRVLGAGNAVLATTTFTDQIRATPSDPRATFVPRNLTQCLQVGFPADVQLGADDSDAAGDNFVVGTPTGSDPDMLQVVITPAGVAAGVVVNAVVVKGSNGSNVYTAPFTPPDETAPQNYISPRTEGGPIANISHWFVCYTFGGIEPPTGSLLVLKRVIPPPGPPVEALPTEFTVEVVCTDPETGDVVLEDTITFGPGGGVGTVIGGGVARSGIPVGSVCTVVEQDIATFPDGTVVTYIPAGAPEEGVVIEAGEAGVVVGVVNDFSNVEVQTGSLQVNKVLIPPPAGVDLPDSFVVHVACSDGTRTDVTVPAGGSATVEGITADAVCVVRERIGSLPPELEVTYSPSPFPRRLAIVEIVADDTVEVTITNDASTIPPPPPPPPPSPPSPPSPPPSPPTAPPAASGGAGTGGPAAPLAQPTGELPFTGAPAVLFGGIGLALIASGLALVRRRKH